MISRLDYPSSDRLPKGEWGIVALDAPAHPRDDAGMSSTPPDPTALFRTMLGEWEKFTNSAGGQAPKSDEFARVLGGATAATSGAQEAFRGIMERALAAANMPSRAEIEDISARLARIEGALFRMEAKLADLAPAVEKPAATGPTRNRKPPAIAGE